jgi:hypothetical protein
MFSRRSVALAVILILVALPVCLGYVRAETTSTGFGVGFTVPNQNNQGGGGQQNNPPPPATPTISNVASSTGFTTASITWNVSSQGGVGAVTFVYGLNTNYGTSGVVGGAYQVSLSNLTAGTVYFFKITAADAGSGGTATAAGSFKTTVNDVTPPVISNVAAAQDATTATITWKTNEAADGQVQYGLTNQYGGSGMHVALGTDHTVPLSNLLPNTTYHYRVLSTDAAGNTAASADATFVTLKDNVAPPDVSSLVLKAISGIVTLSWVNPSPQAVPDFTGVTVVRKVNSKSNTVGDGTVVYKGGAQAAEDKNVLENIVYFYTSFSMDTSGNYSPGAFDSITIAPPPNKEVCNNGVDDDKNGKTDCADTACQNEEVCKVPPKEICNNGIDDDKNNKIDCADGACVNNDACKSPSQEICNNGIDDDKDGALDCADNDCSLDPVCKAKQSLSEICGNNIDDDKNGLMDCADSACFGFSGCQSKPGEPSPGSGYEPPSPTVSNLVRLAESDVVFFAGNNKIKLEPKRSTITAVAGTPLMVEIPRKAMPFTPESVVLKVNGTQQHQLIFDAGVGVYYTSLTTPSMGKHQLSLEILYANKQFDAVTFTINSLPFGSVGDDNRAPLSGAMIVLKDERGEPFPLDSFGQPNPFITNANGTYFWTVPNGRYTIEVTKEGYFKRTIAGIKVMNSIINEPILLIKLPPSLTEGTNPDGSLGENAQIIVGNAAKIGAAAARRGAQFVADKKDDPAVEKTTAQVVAPTAVSMAAVGTLPLISFADVVPLMRFLFLQPLMLLGIKKRAKWGQIYNTLTKLPVDLATVRLINTATGRLVQSKVTDGKGRYAFVIDPGEYRVEVSKNNMVFPSELLKNFRVDGSRENIYHGEPIAVNEEEAVITANIPLDPAGSGELPKRFYLKLALRHIQSVISWVGLVITAISLYISPQWYVWLLLGVHIAFLFLFWRLARPPKVKSWGIMYDKDTQQPVGQVVARLFSSQFNKLVGTQITDRKGRYYFLAGESRYFVTGEHQAYEPRKSDVIDLSGKGEDTIAVNLALSKAQPGQSTTTSPLPSPEPQPEAGPPVAEAPEPATSLKPENPVSLPLNTNYPLPKPEKDIG